MTESLMAELQEQLLDMTDLFPKGEAASEGAIGDIMDEGTGIESEEGP